MKRHFPILLLGACLAFDSQAQSFGDFLKSTVTETARNVITNSATMALTPNAESPKAPAAAEGDALPAGCRRTRGANLSVGPKPDTFEPASLPSASSRSARRPASSSTTR
jgi:hypothetical protein